MIRELRALYRVSQAVGASLDLGDVVPHILSILSEELGMQRGTLALLDPETGELAIEAAHGLTSQEIRRGRYRVGEGVMGRVLQTGAPMVIPNIGAEPLFLNRTGARRDVDPSGVAFLCVPVKVGNRTVGVLSADRLSTGGQDLQEDLRLLTIVAGVVAQAVRIRQMVGQEKARLADENRHLRQALEGACRVENLVGTSRALDAVREQVTLAARSRAPVLLTGEPGTGKETVAKGIHFHSPRAGGPFIRLSCANVPPGLMDEELFGREEPDGDGRGAPRLGQAALAEGGTLFLDAVDRLPLEVQAKLLGLLQQGGFEPAGGGRPRRVDVRVVAATSEDLAREVRLGRFREDLYFRLNAVPIHLPPLRERREDIPLLVRHFLDRGAGEGAGPDRPGPQVAPEAMAALCGYRWPGNVRELRQVLGRAVVVAREGRIERDDLPAAVTGGPLPEGPGDGLEAAVAQAAERLFEAPPPEGVYRTILERVESALVERALNRCGGVRLQAARLLGINRNTLYAKLERGGHR
ncbi:MAG: sigma-54-dependent Fis family transcriptional regulator [Deferrisomatales bacterium]